MDRDRAAEAVPLLTEVLTEYPQNADASYLRGLAYERLNVLEKALADYTASLKAAPDRTDALNNKAVILARMRRFDEAAVEFTRLVELDPQGSLAYRNRGLCNSDRGQIDDALADYAKAIELGPKDASNWYQRATVYLKEKRFAEAIQDYTRAIELDSELAAAWMNRGVAWYRSGDHRKAAEDLQRAQSLDSDIVIPDIDFFSVPETSSATDVSTPVAKWPSVKEAAIRELIMRGFEKPTVVQEFQMPGCGEVDATRDGVRRRVFITIEQPGDSFLYVPLAASESRELLREADENHPATALMIYRTSDRDGTPELSKFDDVWKPDVRVHPLLQVIPRPSEL